MSQKFLIYIVGDRIFSNSQKAFQLENSKKLGELSNGKVIYSSFEAYFLFENNSCEIIKNKKLSSKELTGFFSRRDRDFMIKYLVFRHLRVKGLVVKTGAKFGSEFRVYEKGKNHAKWLVYAIRQSEKLNPVDFISKSRIAHSTGKKILLAIVDSEEKIIFYEIEWRKI